MAVSTTKKPERFWHVYDGMMTKDRTGYEMRTREGLHT